MRRLLFASTGYNPPQAAPIPAYELPSLGPGLQYQDDNLPIDAAMRQVAHRLILLELLKAEKLNSVDNCGYIAQCYHKSAEDVIDWVKKTGRDELTIEAHRAVQDWCRDAALTLGKGTEVTYWTADEYLQRVKMNTRVLRQVGEGRKLLSGQAAIDNDWDPEKSLRAKVREMQKEGTISAERVAEILGE